MNSQYQIELRNKVRNGRAVGNLYIVTRRPLGFSCALVSFSTREEAQAWIAARVQKGIDIVSAALANV